MRKLYIFAAFLMATTTTQAQVTVDFEELELAENSYYDGSDNAGSFTSNGATFSNYFDTEYDMWLGGFAYSNMADDTTSGFSNPASAYPASGANSSANYAIYNTNGTITFDGKVDLHSMALTNTTYAYLSMRDGDGFAKKFGENGDEDYFYINIYGIDGEDTLAVTQFYLADFTAEDENDHYILDSWETIDLSAFEGITSLSFDFVSTDVGEWGVNTPLFFALDDLQYQEHELGIAIEDKSTLVLYPNPATNSFHLEGVAGSYSILNMNGQLVATFDNDGSSSVDVSHLEAGIYFIKHNEGATKTHKLILQ